MAPRIHTPQPRKKRGYETRQAVRSPGRFFLPASPSRSSSTPVLSRATLERAARLGHRVTPAMLGGSRRVGPSPALGLPAPTAAVAGTLQRALKRWKPKKKVPEDYEGVDEKVREVDAAVDAAYEEVAKQLKAGKPQKLAGVSNRRYAHWVDTMSDQKAGANRKAAATGYIIEDHATAGFKNDPMVSLQVTGDLKNSRPDVVVTDMSKGLFGVTGYLDITSTGDAGHVFDKKGNWGTRPYVAESLYPSFDFSDLSRGPLEVDEETLKNVEQWRLGRAKRKWKQVKRDYEYGKPRFEREQENVMKRLEYLGLEQRKRLREPEPEYEKSRTSGKLKRRRRRRYRSPYDSYRRRRLSRLETKLVADMKKNGISIDRSGGIHSFSYDEMLDKQRVAYTWEHIKELYGLS